MMMEPTIEDLVKNLLRRVANLEHEVVLLQEKAKRDRYNLAAAERDRRWREHGIKEAT
jgi:hypothetical protein